MEKKKILILLADVNGGHRAATNALTEVIEKDYSKEYTVNSIDLFDYANEEPFNTSEQSYKLFTTNHVLAAINVFLFGLLNTSIPYNLFYRYTNSKLYRHLEKLYLKEKPDIIISVHPIVSMVINKLKKNYPEFKSVVVITDLSTLLRGWADVDAELLTVPTEKGKDNLITYGVSEDKIVSKLFPLESKMSNLMSKNDFYKETKLDKNKKIILITGGGGGTWNLVKSFNGLIENEDIQIVVMAGRDESLKSNLELKFSENKNFFVFGFVKNLQDYLNNADIVVAKPGPATILEIESLNKKAIFSSPIGKQEFGNIDYLKENPNFRYYGQDFKKLKKYINELLEAPFVEFNRRDYLSETEIIVKKIIS